MNWHALAAAVVGACAAAILIATLACLLTGSWTICRAIHAWCGRHVKRRPARERRAVPAAAPRTPTWSTTTWSKTTWADGHAVIAEPTPTSTDNDPDLHDPRCGTDDQLLRTVLDIWHTPGGDQ